jgi:hypothetical protein
VLSKTPECNIYVVDDFLTELEQLVCWTSVMYSCVLLDDGAVGPEHVAVGVL